MDFRRQSLRKINVIKARDKAKMIAWAASKQNLTFRYLGANENGLYAFYKRRTNLRLSKGRTVKEWFSIYERDKLLMFLQLNDKD